MKMLIFIISNIIFINNIAQSLVLEKEKRIVVNNLNCIYSNKFIVILDENSGINNVIRLDSLDVKSIIPLQMEFLIIVNGSTDRIYRLNPKKSSLNQIKLDGLKKKINARTSHSTQLVMIYDDDEILIFNEQWQIIHKSNNSLKGKETFLKDDGSYYIYYNSEIVLYNSINDWSAEKLNLDSTIFQNEKVNDSKFISFTPTFFADKKGHVFLFSKHLLNQKSLKNINQKEKSYFFCITDIEKNYSSKLYAVEECFGSDQIRIENLQFYWEYENKLLIKYKDNYIESYTMFTNKLKYLKHLSLHLKEPKKLKNNINW